MLLCRVLFASAVYALLHQHVKELIWGTNPQRAVTSPTPWFYWELGNYHPLGNEYLLITPTFKMLKMPEWKYGVFSCNLVSFIKIIEKNSLVLWIPPFQFFFLWKFSNGSHTISSQIVSSLLEISLCFMAPYDMTDGTRHKQIQTRVHFLRAPLPVLFPSLFSFLKRWSLKSSFQTRLPFAWIHGKSVVCIDQPRVRWEYDLVLLLLRRGDLMTQKTPLIREGG